MNFYVAIQDFTGVYDEQSFMQKCKQSSCINSKSKNEFKNFWLDCTKISGTDCYCDDDAQAELKKMILVHEAFTYNLPGLHFFDNGNYHYMSKLWTDLVSEPFDLVIFDHHPDMQPPRFEGILSCGGWVKEVLDKNSFVQNAILIGVADHLIEELKNDPTAEFEKYKNRVTFVRESEIQNKDANAVDYALANLGKNVYVSIDKDALCTSDAVTNWDQGSLTFSQLEQILEKLFSSHKILGIDICGERARNQDYPNGIDEGKADEINNKVNNELFNLIKKLAEYKAFD